ncbi:MAG: SAM-dependent methyltransferase, partial [Mariprofundaceae bacterium]
STMSESTALEQIIRQRISDAGGFLPFDAFMQAALYEPGMGYYESKAIFGEPGDFVTAPDLGPWLYLGLADLLHWGWQELGEPCEWVLLEQGGGSGRLLVDILHRLQQLDMPMPAQTIEVERSAHLQHRQQQLFSESGFVVEHISDLADVGERENILLISNELPDAFPVRCFSMHNGALHERGVTYANRFSWVDAEEPLSDEVPIAQEIRSGWPEGYISEWNPGLAQWQEDLSHIIKRGFSFCVDYGFSQQEYYRPNREQGTLLAHLNHRAVDTVLNQPGMQDITAHIDFTALANAGRQAGLESLLWMPQGAWLAQSPAIQEKIQQLAASPDAESMRLMAQARRMLMPNGMGELFKLLIQSSPQFNVMPAYLSQFNHLADIYQH